MTLTNRDIVELTEWRRKLHRQPEISNEEEKTAKEVVSFLADTGPDKVLTGPVSARKETTSFAVFSSS